MSAMAHDFEQGIAVANTTMLIFSPDNPGRASAIVHSSATRVCPFRNTGMYLVSVSEGCTGIGLGLASTKKRLKCVSILTPAPIAYETLGMADVSRS